MRSVAEFADAPQIFRNRQQFTADGTFTVPNGVTKVWVSLWGGGGGGHTGSSGCGGNGIYRCLVDVTPGDAIAVVVGAGGATNVSGEASSFGALAVSGGAAGRSGATTLDDFAPQVPSILPWGVECVGQNGSNISTSRGGCGAFGAYYGRGGNGNSGTGIDGICIVEW
jgi:hypothetical protein